MSTSDIGALRTVSALKQFLFMPLAGVAVRTMRSAQQAALPKLFWHFGGAIAPLGYNHRLHQATERQTLILSVTPVYVAADNKSFIQDIPAQLFVT